MSRGGRHPGSASHARAALHRTRWRRALAQTPNTNSDANQYPIRTGSTTCTQEPERAPAAAMHRPQRLACSAHPTAQMSREQRHTTLQPARHCSPRCILRTLGYAVRVPAQTQRTGTLRASCRVAASGSERKRAQEPLAPLRPEHCTRCAASHALAASAHAKTKIQIQNPECG